MFEMPETLEGLTIEELTAHRDGASEAFDTAIEALTDEATEEEILAVETIRDHRETLDGAITTAQVALDDRTSRLESLREPAAEPVVEPEVEPVAATEPVAEPVVEPEPVLAAASPVATAAAAAPAVVIPSADPRRITLTAAADVSGYANGQALDDIQAVTQAVLARSRGISKVNLATASGGVRQRYGAALIHKAGFGDDLLQTPQSDDYAMVWESGNQARLPGGSLTAAGWCAPSETLYDLCQLETLEGILPIPEFGVTRGGIRWTQGPSFSDIYAACGFFQTEAEAITGECKDCCSVDCPPFDEIRMDAIGLCIKSPLLTEHAYPELVQRFIEGALIAHAHKVNKVVIDAILLAAGTPGALVDQGRLLFTMMELELVAVGMRYQYRLAQDAMLTVVAPYWLQTFMRQDMDLENDRETGNTTNAEVDAWFAARNLSPEWVYDFQDPVIGPETCEITLPSAATVLVYPQGTWSKGTADVVNLDAVYDSPNLEANQYTALFVEEGILAVQRCTHTCAVTIPICVSGKGVLDDIDVCLPMANVSWPTSTGTGTGT